MTLDIVRAFSEARERAAAAVRAGGNGIEVSRALSGDVDAIVIEAAGAEVAKCRTPVAVFATGGFGRAELAPYSDLDLLVLCAKTPGKEVQALAEAILYPLWDAKVDAGHAVRSYDQALSLPASDLAAATALLDARFLTGDAALADKFLAAFRARVAKTAAEDFVARLRAEQKARHSRFGDTIFLLEPDLKNGPGGMRDLCVGRWAAMARFGTSNAKELLAKGVMTGRLAQAFINATEWLLRVRIAMHAAAGRRMDHLRFALQEAIAPVLCPDAQDRGGVIRPAVHPAVEALMHQYHAHAKLIRNETERLLQRATARDEPRRPSQPVPTLDGGAVDESFVVREGALEGKDGSVFERKPSEMIRIFQVAIAFDIPLSLRTLEMLGELAATRGEALRADPASGPCFMEIVCDGRDRANPSRLEQMQDLGLLGALMPEWEPSTGRVQHDIYHVYTVDQHALYAVGRLHALARGDHADQFPTPTETVRAVTRPVALAAGTLLHDVGKPYGSPHSEIGAGLAVTICRRLGIDEEDIRRVEFLVKQHLVMGQMSQRRDLDDIGMISDFATLCGDEENLHELYLLTFCDLASVAPDAMSSWKETLLGELYSRTLKFLRRGPDLLGAERAEIVERRQKRAAAILEEPEKNAALTTLFGGFPDRYFAENSALRIAKHVRLIRERRAAKKSALVEVSHEERLGMTEMVLAARDLPGLLAEVAGVLYANRIEVVDAAIYSRQPIDPGEEAEALDIFRVRDGMRRPVMDEGRWKKVREDLEAVLTGKVKGEALVAARPRGDSIAAWRTPAVPTEVKIDNDVSRDFTVLEIVTEDRAGVLYAMTRTLFNESLDIHRSKIATEANRAIDVFYVRDKANLVKITDPERMVRLKTTLLDLLAER
ncbi:MAG TPA: [protein-PII] uridylyltransferase [Polyangia bacterium]|jgi:[protein-PII] uridylyltransferase|nr:[protein-PII] uridylyltransferase [Polyangia bacterium]